MDPERVVEIENAHDSGQFNKKVIITRGEGAVLFDKDGKSYIDCIGGHGVSVLGYSHPAIVQALCTYLAAKKPITCGHFYDEYRANLIQRLVDLTPPNLKRVFFSNSGTEAVEAALKFAMKYKKNIKDKEIVAFKRGFHGRTLGALSTTFEQRYREDYSLIPGVKHVSYNDIQSVRDAITGNTIAVIMELVQGEGGVYPASDTFPKEVREVCDEKGILLIFDEIQTGFGRTGKLFALQHWNVAPDVLCLAKGIAAGIPMGATITNDAVMGAVIAGSHGTTFGGNPFACAAGVASLDVMEKEHLPEHAREVGSFIVAELEKMKDRCKAIKEIRGKGLMIGIQCRGKVADYIKRLQEKGVLVLNAGLTVIRLLPPLVITKDQARQVLEALESVLQE